MSDDFHQMNIITDYQAVKFSEKKHLLKQVLFVFNILFPAFTLFQNVFHLSFCDKFIIRFEATNVVQRIS